MLNILFWPCCSEKKNLNNNKTTGVFEKGIVARWKKL